jgi:transposase
LAQVRVLAAEGHSVRAIAIRVKVGKSVVKRALSRKLVSAETP